MNIREKKGIKGGNQLFMYRFRFFDVFVFMRIFSLVAFLLFTQEISAQYFIFERTNPLIFYDYQSSKLCVIEDSTQRIFIDLATNRIQKRTLYLDKRIHFSDVLTNYIVVSEKGSDVYFVDRGCGYVLQLRNDSIVRIDKSFHHQNQYNASFFLYKNTPHTFGGYGFFDYKDYMLKYDHRLCQWFLQTRFEDYSCSNSNPFMVHNNTYYSIAGKVQKDSKSNYFYENLLCYNFSTQKWKNLGKINPSAFPMKERVEFAHKNVLVAMSKMYLYHFPKNEVEIFDLKSISSLMDIFVENDQVIIKSSISQDIKKEIMVSSMPLGEFKKKYLLTKKAIVAPETNVTMVIVMSLLIIASLLVIFFEYRRRSRGKMREAAKQMKLSHATWKLLTLWLQAKELTLEYSSLNDLVNEDGPSVDAIKKRREHLLDLFKEEIAAQTGLAHHEIFSTAQHQADKRMKVIILHPQVKSMAEKGSSPKYLNILHCIQRLGYFCPKFTPYEKNTFCPFPVPCLFRFCPRAIL